MASSVGGQIGDAGSQNGKGLRFWAAFGAVAITGLAASLDAVTLSVALPSVRNTKVNVRTISADLGGSAVEAFWAGTSYPLAQTVTMLNWVVFSHCFGRRPIFLINLVIFGLGAVLCDVSHKYTLMLAGRTIQGIGSGGFIGLTTVVITDLVPLRQRGKFYAVINAVWAIGTNTGPIIGGALAQDGKWRWIFCAFVGIGIFLRLHNRKRTLSEQLRELDPIGSVVFIASLTSFLIPITWGGLQYTWSSWHTLVPLILGVCGLAAFCIIEEVIKKEQNRTTLIPLLVFRNRSVCLLYLGSFFHGVILWALVYYMPEYYQAVKGYSPIVAGVGALPLAATAVPSAIAVGIAVDFTGKYRWAIWAGWSLTTLGCGILLLLGVSTTALQWIFLAIPSGVGLGLIFQSTALAVQASVPQKDVAMAATLVLFFRSFGQTLGVAIGGTIFENRMHSNLEGLQRLPPNTLQYATDAVALVQELKMMPHDSPEAAELRQAFSSSFRIIWAVMCAFAGATMLANFFVKEYTMDQEHITEQGFVQADDEKQASAKAIRGNELIDSDQSRIEQRRQWIDTYIDIESLDLSKLDRYLLFY